MGKHPEPSPSSGNRDAIRHVAHELVLVHFNTQARLLGNRYRAIVLWIGFHNNRRVKGPGVFLTGAQVAFK